MMGKGKRVKVDHVRCKHGRNRLRFPSGRHNTHTHTYKRRRWRRSLGEIELFARRGKKEKLSWSCVTPRHCSSSSCRCCTYVQYVLCRYVLHTYVGPGLDNGPVVDVSVLQISWMRNADADVDGIYKYIKACTCYASQILDDFAPSHPIPCLPSKARPVWKKGCRGYGETRPADLAG